MTTIAAPSIKLLTLGISLLATSFVSCKSRSKTDSSEKADFAVNEHGLICDQKQILNYHLNHDDDKGFRVKDLSDIQYVAHCKIKNSENSSQEFCVAAVSYNVHLSDTTFYGKDGKDVPKISWDTYSRANRMGKPDIVSQKIALVDRDKYMDEEGRILDASEAVTTQRFLDTSGTFMHWLFGGSTQGPSIPTGWITTTYSDASKTYSVEFRDGVIWTSPSKTRKSYAAACERVK